MAGIDPDLVSQAIAELQSQRGLEPRSLLGPPTTRTEIRSVPKELSQDVLKELVRLVDDNVQAPGNVAEALGSIRWNVADRFLSTQVYLEPTNGETII